MELNNTKYWWCKSPINPYFIKMMENVRIRQLAGIPVRTEEQETQEDNIQKVQNVLTLNFDV